MAKRSRWYAERRRRRLKGVAELEWKKKKEGKKSRCVCAHAGPGSFHRPSRPTWLEKDPSLLDGFATKMLIYRRTTWVVE